MRERLLRWFIYGVCKREDGKMLPWWAISLLFVVIPDRVIPATVSRMYYDPMTDCFNLGGIKMSRGCLTHCVADSTPNGTTWWRVARREGGIATIETREENAECGSGPLPLAWTADAPAFEGWYWWREHVTSLPEVIEVYKSCDDGGLRIWSDRKPLSTEVSKAGGIWAGPLLVPKVAEVFS